jgi:tagatose 1,6-diphosphate aldolase
MAGGAFQFLDPGPLVENDLELIAPSPEWVDEVLLACRHPLTQKLDPNQSLTSRQQLLDFLKSAPGGRQPADESHAPSYHFWMRWREQYHPTVRMAGGLGLRIGETPELELYSGHIGYHVYPPARGRHFAERACRLLLPLARRHRLRQLWITCNPDNVASLRTCQRLGARLVEIIPIPASHPFYARGEREKCRFLVEL